MTLRRRTAVAVWVPQDETFKEAHRDYRFSKRFRLRAINRTTGEILEGGHRAILDRISRWMVEGQPFSVDVIIP